MNRLPSSAILALAATLANPLPAQTQKAAAKPNDWRLEAQVQQTLQSDHSFTGSSILSSVNKGVVTLTGNVRSEAEKTLASSEIGQIEGVKTVLNNLNIVDNSAHYTTPTKAAAPSGPKVITLAEGTIVPVRLSTDISTRTAKAGDSFQAVTATNVASASFIAIPAGTPLTGRIVEAKPAGRLAGAAELTIELVSIKVPTANGPQETSIVTQALSSKTNGRGTNTAAKTGGGAAFGAVVGALAGGGGAGAGIGAASGGALGLGANALTRGKDIELKPEQLLQFKTAAPLAVVIQLNNGNQLSVSPTTSNLTSRPEPATTTVLPPQ